MVSDGRDREEVDQEEAADVRQLEEEEDGEGDQGHDRRRSQDVDGLGAEGPAGTRPVEAVDRQDRHPAQRVGDQEARSGPAGLAPERGPVGPEAPERGEQEGRHRDERVGHREQQAELGGVAADHVAASLRRCGPGGNGTDVSGRVTGAMARSQASPSPRRTAGEADAVEGAGIGEHARDVRLASGSSSRATSVASRGLIVEEEPVEHRRLRPDPSPSRPAWPAVRTRIMARSEGSGAGVLGLQRGPVATRDVPQGTARRGRAPAPSGAPAASRCGAVRDRPPRGRCWRQPAGLRPEGDAMASSIAARQRSPARPVPPAVDRDPGTAPRRATSATISDRRRVGAADRGPPAAFRVAVGS